MKSIDRYHIKEEFSGGGMADVYRAYDPKNKREVAIKVIKEHLLNDSEFHERFEREANLMVDLEHPAIVPVYAYGKLDDEYKRPYLVMRLLSGGTLADRIKKGSLSPERVIQLLQYLTLAIDFAHDQGVIHRDLKPDNILFDEHEYDHPYIADFGIAKLLTETKEKLEGTTIGTFAYMSPEQVMGLGDIDRRSDIYALGVILFELLTGKPPHPGLGHISSPIPNVCDVNHDLPQAIQDVIEKAMAKEREKRYATAGQMYESLKEIVFLPLQQSSLGEKILKSLIIVALVSGVPILFLLATRLFGG